MPGENGELCPYIAHGLETEEEHQAWGVMDLAQSTIQITPAGGVMGFDMGVVMQLAESFGYDVGAVVTLIGVAQRILVEKYNKR